IQRVREVRERRDAAAVTAALSTLENAARDPQANLMPFLVQAARADATEGEMVQALQVVFGTYTETPVF
ncbi:MAG: methylmalonyl-CoA mutase, N-terminal domain, partial [Solirubrobacteraceae bacterium]|nr:methylmalonyl-CoA mutase, N-terminal domain [Solirubrobacteraceae bacterium]